MKNAVTTLFETPMLFLDVQASGPRPPKGYPLNVAWCAASAADFLGKRWVVEDRWVLPPEELVVPRRVWKMLELDSSPILQGEGCVAAEEAFAELRMTLEQVPQRRWAAHYASYEEPFLQFFGADQDVFANVLCTHRIAKHLLAGLPRRGIAAVAGYFGHRLEGRYRAQCHVEATLAIWHHFVEILASDFSIESFDDLHSWLADPDAVDPTTRYAMARERRLQLESRPGIYRFVDRQENTLYVGKATDLRSRVNSYFRTRRGLSEKKLEMVSQAADVHVIATKTPLEAALLEVDAIRAYLPPYNVALLPWQGELFFVDRQGNRSAKATRRFRYGPFRSDRALDEALSIWRLAPGEELSFSGPLPPLAGETATEGRRRFAERHGLDAENFDLCQFWRLGNEIWVLMRLALLEAAEEKEIEASEESEESEESAEPEFVWDAEAVVRALERRARRIAFAIRRGRLLACLGDAALTWAPRSSELAVARVQFSKGALPPPDISSEATSEKSDFVSALNALEEHTFDRMRVLATEIKTLLNAEHHLELTLGRRVLGPEELHRLWFWI